MRKLCPNMEREDALDTVLEVPIPDEMVLFDVNANTNNGNPSSNNNSSIESRLQNLALWMKTQTLASTTQQPFSSRNVELKLLLNVGGCPLVPFPIPTDQQISRSVRDTSIQASTAKYIVQQYVAATGGQAALNGVGGWHAEGNLRMSASEFHMGGETTSVLSVRSQEVGSFVLWQKTPELWYLDLVLSGLKLSAGSDGTVSWRQQSSTEQSYVARGPPRPLRRSIQGLDPKSTANMFTGAVCIGEKVIEEEECFILKMETSAGVLEVRSGENFDVIRHTVWGYFSQRTGLLIKFEDSYILRMKTKRKLRLKLRSSLGDVDDDDNSSTSVFWETTMESHLHDYRFVDGINVAHSGTTTITLFRYGEGSAKHKRKIEESWTIEDIDFHIRGLTRHSFLPPADLKPPDDFTA